MLNVGMVWILGGGPAGSAAANFSRCWTRLAAWNDFWEHGPAIIRRLILHFASNETSCSLPEQASGLSRYRFEHLLFNRAVTLGGDVIAASVETALEARASLDLSHSDIWAPGRKARGPRGKRLSGFKAHFRGSADDVVELFFRAGSYAVSPVEYGITKVWGLAPEDLPARYDFEINAFAAGFEILAQRLVPLTRVTKWFLTGPLVYGEQGSPIPPRVRMALERGLAEKLGWLVPAGLLFRATRLTTSGRAGR